MTKRSIMYQVNGFDVLLFEGGESIAFGHDPETGCYCPMENHAAQVAIERARDWQIADNANAAADTNPYVKHGLAHLPEVRQ